MSARRLFPTLCGRKGAKAAALAICSLVSVSWSATALAYIGDSFLSIPDVTGHWRGENHKGWIRAEANDWLGRLPRLNSGSSDPLAGDKLFFGGPNAPKPGNFGRLAIALSKASPDLPLLMRMCRDQTQIPELTFAENSDRARPLLELGQRPAEFPAFWEYRLKNVQVAECPIADGAEQQALVLAFKNIEWLNYDPMRPMANRISVKPEELPRVEPAVATDRKQVKSYLITWIAPATDAPDEACPTFNTKPTEADVFRYKAPEEIAKIKAKNGEKGISYGTQSENRGPGGLSVASFPGIVPDPGHAEPNTRVAFGIDLDGDDGRGAPPKGIRRHDNFVSPDGRTGIDNQLLRVWGCVTGYRGKRGYNNQTPNARRADGNIVTLIQVSDIDDERNDDTVYVSIIHSLDKPVKDNSGKIFIPNYTYRPTDDPNFALFNVRIKGQLKDGVVTTDVLPHYIYNPGQGAATELYQAKIRLEPQPDGSVRGFLAGYQDWRKAALFSGYSEGLFNFRAPGVYYSMKRNADGLKDPVTGEFNGISTVLEIDTVPAFMTPPSTIAVQGGEADGARKSLR
jgi:hypothetical protein